MLTTTGLSAPWLLLELGAAWAFGKKVIPLIGPGATFKDLPGPFGDIHALTRTDKVGMSGLAEPIAFAAGLGLTNNFPKMQSGLEEFTALAAQRKRETAEKTRPVTPPMNMPAPGMLTFAALLTRDASARNEWLSRTASSMPMRAGWTLSTQAS